MKVLQLTQRFPPAIGGVENHVFNLASELTKKGVDVEVFTSDSARDIPFERLEDDNLRFPFKVRRFHAFKIANLPHGLGVVAPSMLFGSLSHHGDLVHAHSYGYFTTYAGAFVRRVRKFPLVITTHSDAGRPHLQKRLFDAITPLLTLRQAQRVIAITKSEAMYLRSLGVQSQRITIIPNGINLADFEGKSKRIPKRESANILYVGRVYPEQKGLETLIRSIYLISHSKRPIVNIVGEDWGGSAGILNLANKLKVQDRVKLLGRLDSDGLVQAYNSADLFVMPSLFEPFGIVLLEAMASGLPIVASRVGGIPEVVEEGKTAMLVPPGNPEELRIAIEALLSNDRLRRAMGHAGRERAALFSWSRIIPRILRVYEEAIAEIAN